MKVFKKLKLMREFEKLYMPYLDTLEDFDLVLEIGFYQSQDEPLTLKRLFLLDIASVATVQRRLAKLKKHGVVTQDRSEHDRRRTVLCLPPETRKLFRKYESLFFSK